VCEGERGGRSTTYPQVYAQMFKFWKKKPESDATPRIRERVLALESLVADLEHDLKLLNTKHYKLAGSFYGRFGSDGGGSSPKTLSKAELRARLGIVPGKPLPTITTQE